MLSSRAKRELKIDQRRILIDSIEIRLASPHQIRVWGERQLPNGRRVGQIKNSKTVNYKRFTPLRDGLFCERIFGPVNSFVCACGKRQPRADVLFCEKCEVEYTDQRTRRYRLGFIPLVSPAAHVWYLKGRPSYLPLFLGKRKKRIVALSYCNAYLIEQAASSVQVLPHLAKRESHGTALFSDQVGGDAQARKLSEQFDIFLNRGASGRRGPTPDRGEGKESMPATSTGTAHRNVFSKQPYAERGHLFEVVNHSRGLETALPSNGHTPKSNRGNSSQAASFFRFLVEVVGDGASKTSTERAGRGGDLPPASPNREQRFADSDANTQKRSQRRSGVRRQPVLSTPLRLFSNLVLSSPHESWDLCATSLFKRGVEGGIPEPLNDAGRESLTSLLKAQLPSRHLFNRGLSASQNGTRRALVSHSASPLTRNRVLSASTQSKQGITHVYDRAQSMPFLPTFVCKYNLRDELLNLLDSPPAIEDLPLPRYCQIERWQPLRDVHKFMAELPLKDGDNPPPIGVEMADAAGCAKGATASATSAPLTRSRHQPASTPLTPGSTGRTTLASSLSPPPALLTSALLPEQGIKRLWHSEVWKRHAQRYRSMAKQKQEQIGSCAKRLLSSVYQPPLGEGGEAAAHVDVATDSNQNTRSLSRDPLLDSTSPTKGDNPLEAEGMVLAPFLIPPQVVRSRGIKEVLIGEGEGFEGIHQGTQDIGDGGGNTPPPHEASTATDHGDISLEAEQGGGPTPPLSQEQIHSAKATNSRPQDRIIKRRGFFLGADVLERQETGRGISQKAPSGAPANQGKNALISTYASTHKPLLSKPLDALARGLDGGNRGRRSSHPERPVATNTSLDSNPLSNTPLDSSSKQRRGSRRETDSLSPLEFVTIREILSYTGGGALERLLRRFDTALFSTFLSTEIQIARETYKKRISLLDTRPNRSERRTLARLCRRMFLNARRLKLSQLLTRSQRRPEWMMISTLPVLPPDLRPILQMSESLVVASDLNNLYQRVVYRNNRYHKLRFIDFHLVTAIQRLVQDAVDRLIENGKGGAKPFYTPGGRPLKSLSDTLKGKRGRFRLNLLGKRVDFSGRSVIVVSPHLKIHECGLPRAIALELYHYFILRGFMVKRQAYSIVVAKKLIKQQKPAVWNMLRDVIYHHPLLLNRAPTLHRLGIQAFQPRLVLGNAILLHPLVCSGFNADFDGDQMGVHLPLSLQARAEAWDLLWSRNNLLSPATGQPVLMPSQDMVLGLYYMTQLLLNRSLVESCSQPAQKLSLTEQASSPHRDTSIGGNSKKAVDLAGNTNGNSAPLRVKRTYAHKPTGWQLPQSRKLFLTQIEVIHALQEGSIDLHTPVWLQCDVPVENDEATHSQAPLELRVTSMGGSVQIFSQYKRREDLRTSLSRIYLRTTAGRVLINDIIFSSKPIL